MADSATDIVTFDVTLGNKASFYMGLISVDSDAPSFNFVRGFGGENNILCLFACMIVCLSIWFVCVSVYSITRKQSQFLRRSIFRQIWNPYFGFVRAMGVVLVAFKRFICLYQFTHFRCLESAFFKIRVIIQYFNNLIMRKYIICVGSCERSRVAQQ